MNALLVQVGENAPPTKSLQNSSCKERFPFAFIFFMVTSLVRFIKYEIFANLQKKPVTNKISAREGGECDSSFLLLLQDNRRVEKLYKIFYVIYNTQYN